MKKNVYMIFKDIKATSKNDALEKFAEEVSCSDLINDGVVRVQENLFDDYEDGLILELARLALSDAEVFDNFADKMDISDKELKNLQKKIETITNND